MVPAHMAQGSKVVTSVHAAKWSAGQLSAAWRARVDSAWLTVLMLPCSAIRVSPPGPTSTAPKGCRPMSIALLATRLACASQRSAWSGLSGVAGMWVSVALGTAVCPTGGVFLDQAEQLIHGHGHAAHHQQTAESQAHL